MASSSWRDLFDSNPRVLECISGGRIAMALNEAQRTMGRPVRYDALDRACRRHLGSGLGRLAGGPRVQPIDIAGMWFPDEDEDDVRDPYGLMPSAPDPFDIPLEQWAAEYRKKRNPGKKHLFIPDLQMKPGVPLNHLVWIARYAAAKRPDRIIFAGDGHDFPSLSSYDGPARKARAGRNVMLDLEVGNIGYHTFDATLRSEGWVPGEDGEVYVLGGNHDCPIHGGRPRRWMDDNPENEGILGLNKFAHYQLGYHYTPFMNWLELDGVTYSHLFNINLQGKFSPTAQRTGQKPDIAVRGLMRSCTAGHTQGLQVWPHPSDARSGGGLVLPAQRALHGAR